MASIEHIIRLSGSGSCLLMVVHSLSYIFCPQYSFWRLLRNLADLALFGGLGVAGMIAELWPRDSKAHKVIRAVLPFMTSFIGRAVFYIVANIRQLRSARWVLICQVIGMLCSGNYTYKSVRSVGEGEEGEARMLMVLLGENDGVKVNSGFWSFFCVLSGLFMISTGALTLYYAIKYKGLSFFTTSPRQRELSTPMMSSTERGGTRTDASVLEEEALPIPFAPFPPEGRTPTVEGTVQ